MKKVHPVSCLTNLSAECHSNLLKSYMSWESPYLCRTKHSLNVRARRGKGMAGLSRKAEDLVMCFQGAKEKKKPLRRSKEEPREKLKPTLKGILHPAKN